MLLLPEILKLINEKAPRSEGAYWDVPPYMRNKCAVYYRMSLHIDGICPSFIDYRWGQFIPSQGGNWETRYPYGWGGNEYDYIFNTFIYNRHQREAEVSRQWRLGQHKPFTQAPFKQAIQVITGAIFQDSGYSITVNDRQDNDYIWGNNFHDKTLPGYIEWSFQKIAEDPNGVFITIPRKPADETTTERIEPDIWFVYSKHIIHHTDDEIIFRVDDIVWAVNKEAYYRFQKQGEEYVSVDVKGFYYTHLLGYKPIVVAGGEWNTQGHYESWLNAARPWADEFLTCKSAEQLVDKEATHPWIIEADMECPECDASGKRQWCGTCSHYGDECSCGVNTSFVLRACNNCNGTGSISHNPGEHILVPAERMGEKMVDIVNPSVEVPRLHMEKSEKLYAAILKALHLNFIEQAQSGIAKERDMETRYQFILRISNDLFGRLIPHILDTILSLRNVRVNNGIPEPFKGDYIIIKPTEFQVKTSYDLLAEYKEGKESQIPDFQLSALLNEYVDKQFGGNDILLKKTKFITCKDPLAVKTDADIQIVVMNNFVSQRKAQYHYELPNILDEIITTKGAEWFLKADIPSISAEVDKLFAAIAPPTPSLRPEVIDRNYV